MIRLFHYMQYVQYPFSILAIYYIFWGSYFEPNLNDVGFGVLCMGIAFAFSSMGDVTQISQKEEKLFASKNRFRRTYLYLLIVGFTCIFVTVFFISQKWTKNNELGDQFYQLGLNCFPLIIAVFFTLKQLIDKKQYHELKSKEVKQVIDSGLE